MGHGEVGRSLTCRVEQPGGVAVDEVERPYCLIESGDGRCRRAGEDHLRTTRRDRQNDDRAELLNDLAVPGVGLEPTSPLRDSGF